MDQLSFASLDYAAKKKRTKLDVFLAEMAAVVPWVALEAVGVSVRNERNSASLISPEAIANSR